MKTKKVAAALAAVNLYLEEEARAAATVSPAPLILSPAWAQSGRESIMNLRQQVNLRLWRK